MSSLKDYTLTLSQSIPSVVKYGISNKKNDVRSIVLETSVKLTGILMATAITLTWLRNPNSYYQDGNLRIMSKGISIASEIKTSWDYLYSLDGLKVGVLWLLTILLVLKRWYIEESFMALQSFGVQLSTSSPFYLISLWSKPDHFIPVNDIVDIIIHEGFKGFQVIYYMAIIVKDQKELTLVFPSLLPRRKQLERIWRGSRRCLYRDKPSRLEIPQIVR
ncbi:hypothetical protein NADFUDRAFT_47647 [Nadsonia fulvescens var. elongata DSM 6958]|uniref:Phosphatidylinositol N-acetylglucosaminyltransferase subunit H conserved domain-containing protein n=1 Tax=Nadsonia fulvescens var. elongata DSM 6958 TaxID=857566 RepID=A0A1E3PG21_9ASCO|nr:hypothetical protein NADFUDRAFT_47647 [Nadsonia fulvescens var. elongata DSM 6958]